MTDPTRPETEPSLSQAVRESWRRFTQEFEPVRPELYRYCRSLTHSPWDAEDLVQDSLARAFVSLGTSPSPPDNPRAWLFRVASNHWLNQVKRRREDLTAEPPEPAPMDANPRAVREAGGSLVGQLAPKERAAVVLKEAFDFSLEETAEVLSTSVGAVKAALHRGREKLKHAEAELEPPRTPCPAVLDEFCMAFNAHDLERLMGLLLDTTEVELAGTFRGFGKEAAKRALGGLMFAPEQAVAAGIAEAQRGDLLLVPPRFELVTLKETALVLAYFQHASGEAVRSFTRLGWEAAVGGQAERISTISTHLHSPEALSEICGELGLPCRTNGYRNW